MVVILTNKNSMSSQKIQYSLSILILVKFLINGEIKRKNHFNILINEINRIFYLRFYMPHGLSIDTDGNLWLTDVAMHQVRKKR
jgi:hypothetical protein